MILGDFASVYLAYLNGVDPRRFSVIDHPERSPSGDLRLGPVSIVHPDAISFVGKAVTR